MRLLIPAAIIRNGCLSWHGSISGRTLGSFLPSFHHMLLNRKISQEVMLKWPKWDFYSILIRYNYLIIMAIFYYISKWTPLLFFSPSRLTAVLDKHDKQGRTFRLPPYELISWIQQQIWLDTETFKDSTGPFSCRRKSRNHGSATMT